MFRCAAVSTSTKRRLQASLSFRVVSPPTPHNTRLEPGEGHLRFNRIPLCLLSHYYSCSCRVSLCNNKLLVDCANVSAVVAIFQSLYEKFATFERSESFDRCTDLRDCTERGGSGLREYRFVARSAIADVTRPPLVCGSPASSASARAPSALCLAATCKCSLAQARHQLSPHSDGFRRRRRECCVATNESRG